MDVATIIIDYRISAVPVVDQGELVGIVTDNYLIRRVELGTERARPRWLHLFTSEYTLLAEYKKAMTKPKFALEFLGYRNL